MAEKATVQIVFGIGVAVLCSLLLATTVVAQSDVSFIARRDFRVGEIPQSITVGDFNGDGRQDLATANAADDTVSILLGRGDGTFQAAPAVAVGWFPVSVTVGDFNGDGRQDLATANGDGNTVSILLGRGDGTFQAAPEVAVGVRPRSVTVGDFNGDGRQDLATANGDADTVSILINNTARVVVNDLVTFDPILSTFRFTPDATGCPPGFVGTFRFEARLTNASDRSLTDLGVVVATLTNGNLLQNADGSPGGVGSRLTVPEQDGFSDGVLSPDEWVDVPFVICLMQRRRFQFVMDVLGVVEASTDAESRAQLVKQGARIWAPPPE